MNSSLTDAPAVPLLAGDEWWSPEATEYAPVYNPSRGEIIARVPLGGAAEVERAVQAAVNAFPGWSRTPASARASRLFAFKAQLELHFEELAALLTCENGKTLDEARGETDFGDEDDQPEEQRAVPLPTVQRDDHVDAAR